MKSILQFFIFIGLFVPILNGCIKDDKFDNGTIQSIHSNQKQNVIGVGNTVTDISNFLQLSFDKKNSDTSVQVFPVTLSSPNPAPEDINVVLTPNVGLIGDYNSSNGTSLQDPGSLVKIINPKSTDNTGYVVTIPKGSNTGYLTIKFIPANLLGGQYAMGYQIASIQQQGYVISSNLSKAITGLSIKNEFDGVYSYKGYSLRAGDATLTGYFSGKSMTLITSGASSVAFATLALWGDGNSGIGIGLPSLAVNNTVASPYPVTITSSGGATNNPGYTSRYDVPSKTFYISFTWGAGPASRLSTDTLTYVGPR